MLDREFNISLLDLIAPFRHTVLLLLTVHRSYQALKYTFS